MGLLNLCMKKHPFSRAFHFILIVPCVILAVMAAVCIGSFVPLHLSIRDYTEGGDDAEGQANAGSGNVPVSVPSVSRSDLQTCILFATPDRDNLMVDYQPDNACDFTIWGQVAVGSLAVAIATVLFLKAFLGIKVFSWFALIELFLSLAGFVFTMALGVVITIGLDDTCRAYQIINNLNANTEFMPCEEYRFADSSISFYSQLNTLRIVTWVEAAILFILLLWYLLIALLKCAACCAGIGKKEKNKPTKLENAP